MKISGREISSRYAHFESKVTKNINVITRMRIKIHSIVRIFSIFWINVEKRGQTILLRT